jgi:hypothetical protein
LNRVKINSPSPSSKAHDSRSMSDHYMYDPNHRRQVSDASLATLDAQLEKTSQMRSNLDFRFGFSTEKATTKVITDISHADLNLEQINYKKHDFSLLHSKVQMNAHRKREEQNSYNLRDSYLQDLDPMQ